MGLLATLLVDHPGAVRGVLVGVLFVAVLVWQRWRPRRRMASGWLRTLRNIALTAISGSIVHLLLPMTTVAFAWLVEQHGWGLFNQVDWPAWLEITLSVIVLDIAIYWQHRCFHVIPALWPIHRVHHTDTEFDVSLGLRFHPIEILLSLLYKLALIALVGVAALGIVIYEILLATFALLTHANVALSPRWDVRLRLLLVTPDWHRVHHSVHRDETDSNYGNILSLWDRLFASYVAQPRDGHAGMQIGLGAFRDEPDQTLPALLLQPIRRASNPDSNS